METLKTGRPPFQLRRQHVLNNPVEIVFCAVLSLKLFNHELAVF